MVGLRSFDQLANLVFLIKNTTTKKTKNKFVIQIKFYECKKSTLLVNLFKGVHFWVEVGIFEHVEDGVQMKLMERLDIDGKKLDCYFLYRN